MIGELVCRPLLPENLLNQEKGTILQEMAMIEDHPMSRIWEKFEALIFGPSTALGRDKIGTKETISGMKVKQLMDYRLRRYRPDNSVFVVAGGVKPEEVVRLAEKEFALAAATVFSRVAGRRVPLSGHPIRPFPVNSNIGATDVQFPRKKIAVANLRTVEFRRTDQVHLEMGRKAFGRQDPRRYALSLLMTVLGGNASSRLFQIVREKMGLAYYVHSGSTRYEEDGYVAISAGVAPDKAAKAESEILKIVRGLKVSTSELSEAKGYALGHLALAWEESDFIAGHLADDFLFENSVRSRREIEKIFKKVSLAEVNSLSDWLFGDNQPLSLAAIGPVSSSLEVKGKNQIPNSKLQ